MGYPTSFSGADGDEYVGCPDVQDKDAFAARVHSSSMMPKYQPGDIVIFSPAATPNDGDDCFVRFRNGDTTFSRAYFEPDQANALTIRLESRDGSELPKTVLASLVTSIYKAVFKYQSVDETGAQ